MVVSQKCHSAVREWIGNGQSEYVAAKKHKAVANHKQTELGGNTYPLPLPEIEMLIAGSPEKRLKMLNARRTIALIANMYDARSIAEKKSPRIV